MYSDLLLTLSALSVVEQSCGILTHKLATEEWYLVFSGLVVTPEEPYLYCSFEQLMYFVAGSDSTKTDSRELGPIRIIYSECARIWMS